MTKEQFKRLQIGDKIKFKPEFSSEWNFTATIEKTNYGPYNSLLLKNIEGKYGNIKWVRTLSNFEDTILISKAIFENATEPIIAKNGKRIHCSVKKL